MKRKHHQLRPTVHIDAIPALRRRRSAVLPALGAVRRAQIAGAVSLPFAAAAGLFLSIGSPLGGDGASPRDAPQVTKNVAAHCECADTVQQDPDSTAIC